MNKVNYIIYTLAFLLSAGSVAAQVDSMVVDSTALDTLRMADGINVDEVTVLKEFDAKLIDASSIDYEPDLPASVERTAKYQYDITVVPLELEYPDPVIKPYAMPTDPPHDVFKYHLEGGYGNMKNPSARLGVQHSFADRLDINFYGAFDGLDNSDEVSNQKFNDAKAGLALDFYKFDNHVLDLDLGGNWRQQNYYSSTQDSVQNVDVLVLRPTIGIRNIVANNGFRYRASIGSSIGIVDDRSAETGLSLDSEVWRDMGRDSRLGLELHGVVNDYLQGDGRDQGALLRGRLAYELRRSAYWFKVGAAGVYSEEEIVPWPSAEVGVNISNGRFQALAGAALEAKDNMVSSMSREVAYVDEVLDSWKPSVFRKLYAGLRGNLGLVSYDGRVTYSQVDNYLMWDFYDGDKVKPIYDDGIVVEIAGSAEAKVREWVAVGGRVRQQIVDLDTEDDILGVPLFELGAYGQFRFWDGKLSVRPELMLRSAAATRDGEAEGNEQVDLSVEARYGIGRHSGVYVRVLNVLDQSYRRFPLNNGVGLHGQAGAWLRF